jgi:hypothetical protein
VKGWWGTFRGEVQWLLALATLIIAIAAGILGWHWGPGAQGPPSIPTSLDLLFSLTPTVADVKATETVALGGGSGAELNLNITGDRMPGRVINWELDVFANARLCYNPLNEIRLGSRAADETVFYGAMYPPGGAHASIGSPPIYVPGGLAGGPVGTYISLCFPASEAPGVVEGSYLSAVLPAMHVSWSSSPLASAQPNIQAQKVLEYGYPGKLSGYTIQSGRSCLCGGGLPRMS